MDHVGVDALAVEGQTGRQRLQRRNERDRASGELTAVDLGAANGQVALDLPDCSWKLRTSIGASLANSRERYSSVNPGAAVGMGREFVRHERIAHEAGSDTAQLA